VRKYVDGNEEVNGRLWRDGGLWRSGCGEIEDSEELRGVKCTWVGVWLHGWSASASSGITKTLSIDYSLSKLYFLHDADRYRLARTSFNYSSCYLPLFENCSKFVRQLEMKCTVICSPSQLLF
jgi:hypothetical protein